MAKKKKKKKKKPKTPLEDVALVAGTHNKT
jgi:hypothetical protein